MQVLTNKGKANLKVPVNANSDSNGNIATLCPFCSHTREKHPNHKCGSVNIKKSPKAFNCHHCGAKGYEVLQGNKKSYVAQPLKIDIKDHIDTEIEQWFLKSRGLSRSILEMFFIYTPKKYNIITKKSEKCIAYPLIDDGEIYDLQYRFNPKHFQREKDGTRIIFGLDYIKHSNKCIITEGYEDAMSWYQAKSEIPACSIPCGVQISDEEKRIFEQTGKLSVKSQLNLDYIDKCYEHFENKDVIYIASDNDPAGVKLREELSRRFGKHRCKYITFEKYPDKEKEGKTCKDSNSVLVQYGSEELLKTLDDAKDFPVEGVITIDDDIEAILYEYDHGKEKGLSLGFESIDPHLNIMPSHVTAFNGYRQMGKTSFAFQVALNMAYFYDYKIAMYSPENYPTKRCFDTLIEMILDNTTDIDRIGRAKKGDIVNYAVKFIKSRIFFVEDNDIEGYTHGKLIEKYIEMIKRFGIKMVITDPWNNLIEDRKYGETTIDTFLNRELGKQVRFAKAYNIINWINAHPKTPKEKNRLNSVASDLELYGGAVWGNKCHEICAIHYDRGNTAGKPIIDVEFYSQKVKDQKICGIPNPEDPVPLRFKRRSGRYYELDKDNNPRDPLENIIKDIKSKQYFTFGI